MRPRNALRVMCSGLLVLLLAGAAWAQRTPTHPSVTYPKDLPGKWSGVLRIGEEDMPFEFELYERDGQPAGALVCGDERIPFSSVELAADEVTFRLAQFGGRLHAKIERIQSPDSTETFPTMRGDYTLPDGKGGKKHFWIEAVHMAPVVQKDPDDPEDATELWGTWRYQLTADGQSVEEGTLELTHGKAPREEAWARMTPTKAQRGRVVLRGVGSKFPQMPTEEQLEAWVKSGKKPTKAELKTVEGILFTRFDGQQALLLTADLQSDGTLSGSFWANGAKLSFRATRPY